MRPFSKPAIKLRLCLALCSAFLCDASVCHAHPVVTASAIVNIRPSGRIQITVHHDALAFALNDTPRSIGDQAMLDLLAGPHEELERTMQEGRDRFDHLFALRANDAPVRAHVTIAPNAGSVLEYREAAIRVVLPVKMDIVTEADLPPGTTRIALKFPEVMGDVVLTVAPPRSEASVGIAQAGDWSRDFALPEPIAPSAPEQAAPAPVAPAPAEPEPLPAPSSAGPTAWSTPFDFTLLGIFHILPDGGYFAAIAKRFHSPHPFADLGDLIPDGADHILFVLGLFFLSPRLRPVIFQVTAFTVAHSVTIALAASGKVTLAAGIVEPLIAASIAAVAIENVFTRNAREGKLRPWRLAIVFVFGLIHGLGFAASFKDAIGAEKAPLIPILFFNIGVELGQLAVVALALLLLHKAKSQPWYRSRIAIPASICIAAIGTLWFIQRVFF